MGLRTYLKDKKRKVLSRYSKLQESAQSKFHKWNIEKTQLIPSMGSNLVNFKEDQSNKGMKPNEGIDLPSQNAKLTKIIVVGGNIVEKIYKDARGKAISKKGIVV